MLAMLTVLTLTTLCRAAHAQDAQDVTPIKTTTSCHELISLLQKDKRPPTHSTAVSCYRAEVAAELFVADHRAELGKDGQSIILTIVLDSAFYDKFLTKPESDQARDQAVVDVSLSK